MSNSDGMLLARNHEHQMQPASALTIENLDEDSLLEVFAFLSFDELLYVSRVCIRFLELSRRCLRKIQHFELDYRALLGRKDDQLTRLKDIFTNIGPHLKAFRFSGGFIMNETLKQSIIENVALHCDSLQHLTLNYIELDATHLTTLKPLLSHLTGLDLGRCTLRDDAFGQFIPAASQLKTLAIPGNAELDGRFFDMWRNCELLEQLDISYCYSLNVGQLEQFLPRAINLRGVDVTACHWLQKDKGIFYGCGRNIELGAILPVFSYYKSA